MMSSLSATIEVGAPPEKLFTHVSTLWESGAALGGKNGVGGSSSARMGAGFRLRCPGRRWQVPVDTELEVRDYSEPQGWRAVSHPDSLEWKVRIARREAGARITCVLRYAPHGAAAGLREALVGRHRRRCELRQLLGEWKAGAERQEALRRLRAAARASGPDTGGERAEEDVSRTLTSGGTQCLDAHRSSSC